MLPLASTNLALACTTILANEVQKGEKMVKNAKITEQANYIAVFQETSIRRVWHNEEWWFSISDVVVVLTDSADPRQYIKKMRSRDQTLNANWGTTCTPLALLAPDGKMRATNCANTESLFRIIQSIPSPKAEPFKRWLAKVDYERVKEIEYSELAIARARCSRPRATHNAHRARFWSGMDAAIS
ncbi:MAG: Bro-N domain-containing protein [Rhodoferax sp.]|nr:Bro-N domain-containing protein [Rhodoferax sp.]